MSQIGWSVPYQGANSYLYQFEGSIMDFSKMHDSSVVRVVLLTMVAMQIFYIATKL